MKLENFLSLKRSDILKKWFDLIVDTYPSGASNLLRNEKDQFDNPVGHTIHRAIEALYEALLQWRKSDEISPFIDDLIRVRAVQNFSPSQAISFIFLLKKAIRMELLSTTQENLIVKEILELESRIDDMALQCFDIYMKCREKIYEIRVNEVKKTSRLLLERANLMRLRTEGEPDLKEG